MFYQVVNNKLTASTDAGFADPDAEVFTFALNPTTGAWTFTLLDQIDHALTDDPSTTGTVETAFEDDLTILLGSLIQATDFDGDMVTASGSAVQVVVNDDTPIRSGPISSGTVDEDGVFEGVKDNGPGDGIRAAVRPITLTPMRTATTTKSTVTGTIAGLAQFQSGADEPLTFSLVTDTSALEAQNLKSGGVALAYAVSGNVLTASTDSTFADPDAVFTFTLNPGGAWVFDLEDQLDHPRGQGDENDLTILLGSLIQATDVDGDIAPGGAVQITVNDDTPIAAVEPQAVSATVVEDALLTTAPGDTGDLSDGNLDAGQDNSGDEASGLAGSLTTLFEEGADEPLTYTLSTVTSGLPTLFSKGDAVSYAVVVNDNGTPADLSDDISTLTATAGGRTVFTLVVNADGSWTFDLDDQLDHVDASGDAGFNLITAADGSTSVPSIDFSSILVATDFDGDSVTGAATDAFTIEIENDVPVASGDTETAFVQEDDIHNAQSDGNDEDGSLLDSRGDRHRDSVRSGVGGADEPVTFSWAAALDGSTASFTSKGDTVTYSVARRGSDGDGGRSGERGRPAHGVHADAAVERRLYAGPK